jgi:ADP-heptose:LPS heptosyltransferase
VSGPKRILVVRAGALGDTLMVTPLLRALREKLPASEIDVLCSRLAAGILELTPGVARRFALRYRNLPYAISPEKRKIVRELRARNYDFAILLERANRYRFLLERAGVRDVRSFRETPFDPGVHAIVNNLRAAGLEERGGRLDMEVFLSEDDRERAAALSSGLHPPRIGIHVGYGPRGKKRNQSERLKGWSSDNFTEVASGLLARGASLVFTGSREDRRDVEAILARLPAAGSVLNLAGRTSLRELAAVIENLDVLVSVDSGPAHLAAAMGTPLVVLWGPAILEQVRPLSSRSRIAILRHPPPCAPCYETPLMKTCRRNVCMESITPREVIDSVEALLDRGENPTTSVPAAFPIPPTH